MASTLIYKLNTYIIKQLNNDDEIKINQVDFKIFFPFVKILFSMLLYTKLAYIKNNIYGLIY